MILVRLAGGLGNQLFQYAAGRALALRNGVDLMLDARDLGRGVAHAVYGLDRFRIKAVLGAEGDLPPGRRARPLRHLLWRGFGRAPRFVRERGLGLNRDVLTAGDWTYLHGYWQSESYFADCVDVVRRDLSFAVRPSEGTQRLLEGIVGTEGAVSVHVRRGDYVATRDGRGTHGACDAEYYRRAIALVRQRTGLDLHAIVFSDDPDWARENLKLDCRATVVDVNSPLAAHDDLRLMAACRHHVIANSTFSWWGAWLDPRPDKIVVAPERWFADPKLRNPDLIPKDWTVL